MELVLRLLITVGALCGGWALTAGVVFLSAHTAAFLSVFTISKRKETYLRCLILFTAAIVVSIAVTTGLACFYVWN
jgi:hypothetical protein